MAPSNQDETTMPASVRQPSLRRCLPLFALATGVALLLAARTGGAQEGTLNRDAAIEVRKQFLNDLDSLQKKFVTLAEAFPEGKYSWRPHEGVRSVGEVFMHVASEYYVFTPMAYGATPSTAVTRSEEGFKKFEAMSTKAEVLKHLKESFAYTTQSLGAIDGATLAGTRKLFGGNRTIAETSTIMTADLHEHLGQLIAYARMNDVKPPWSR
jgi:DinB superfamily